MFLEKHLLAASYLDKESSRPVFVECCNGVAQQTQKHTQKHNSDDGETAAYGRFSENVTEGCWVHGRSLTNRYDQMAVSVLA